MAVFQQINWILVLVVLVLILLGVIAWLLFTRRPQASEFVVRDQVIVNGRLSAIKEVIEEVSNSLAGIELKLVKLTEDILPGPAPEQEPADSGPYTKMSPRDDDDEGAAQIEAQATPAPGDPDRQVTALVLIERKGRKGNKTSLFKITRKINEVGGDRGVVSDPNYKIGRAVREIAGDPTCGEGSAVLDGIPSDRLVFLNQWALKPRTNDRIGIQLVRENDVNGDDKKPDYAVEVDGGQVLIGVFDTSPMPWQNRFAAPDVDAKYSPGVECLYHDHVGAPDARDHGTFVASLVNVISPNSEVHVFRVLNDNNRGDLFTLLGALDYFMAQSEATSFKRVINLSLGVYVDPDRGSDDVPTLRRHLQDIYNKGVVIVAAAGNDSGQSDIPKPAQIPASYDFVIGVGATNKSGQRANFSNLGEVYAPGGDTALNEFVVGYARHISKREYAYWQGTSFSTPQVSGLAALLLGKDNTMSPRQVKAMIISKAYLVPNQQETIKVIDVVNTMS